MNNNECSICFEPVGDTNVAITECGHKFHLSCYKKWSKKSCPMCRTKQSDKELLSDMMKHMSIEDDKIDKPTLLLYMSTFLQNNVENIQSMYRGLVMHFIKLYLETRDENLIEYILDNKLYSLLSYYDTTSNEVQELMIIQDNVQLVKYINFNDETMLTIVKNGCINLLQHYKDKIDTQKLYSCKPNTTILNRFNLFGIACMQSYLENHLEMVQYLCQFFDINEPNKWNCTPLFAAIASANLDVVKWLVNQGVDINVKHVCSSTPLFFAIEKNYYNIAHYLINKGANVDSTIVRACVNFTNDYKKGWKLLERVLKMVSKNDVYIPNFQFCFNSNGSHIDETYCECHESNSCCFCSECRVRDDMCSGRIPTFVQVACERKKLYTILLLLAFDFNLANQKQEICINYDKHTQNSKWMDCQLNNYKTFNFDGLSEYLFYNLEETPKDHVCGYKWECAFGCKYKTIEQVRTAAEYIYKLIERGDKVSWKHQRKVLDKLMKNCNAKY